MYICICEEVTDKQIKNAIQTGANSMRKLCEELGVATECRQCARCVKGILKGRQGARDMQLAAK